jgi:hypothetical protein
MRTSDTKCRIDCTFDNGFIADPIALLQLACDYEHIEKNTNLQNVLFWVVTPHSLTVPQRFFPRVNLGSGWRYVRGSIAYKVAGLYQQKKTIDSRPW